ncbi:Beta-galactosidase C-terminal domain [Sinomonas sp. JGH33]|uniref:Beta-galactosidase C-terminal domain n=1 Tax=Sinomonas terricola TaxID=3110330 RepID=A0ABU5T5V2_9MICC|nr:Beta-galactosidase C-terminal domain [Sinomonas sp. JGH33]MEA5455020.1 Beta-galactosidase C-terminal domain [Sinomonas sp. JGH33]
MLEAPRGVQVRQRSGRGKDSLLLLNHNDAPASVDVPSSGTDVLAGSAVHGRVELPACGVLVVERAFEEA